MNFSSKHLSQAVTQLCLAKEIDHIVISPGSRNAPLIIGFTGNESFRCFSIVDERSAAFFALGMAQQLNRPVALVCTSGSALLNYYPAIAEAYYSDVPLVVLSADRPPELLEIGDGQTIRQENVFSNHILYSANCKEAIEHQLHNETEINIALNTAIELKGPVHINLPFAEPLYETSNDLQVRPQHVPARQQLDDEKIVSELIKNWNRSRRKMILSGVLAPDSLSAELINELADIPGLIVLTETTSNFQHENFFPGIDQLIAPLENNGLDELQPDILITIGGMVVSKKVKAFLRKYPPKYHWHIDPKRAWDTYFSLNGHIKNSPGAALAELLDNTEKVNSDFRGHWLKIKENRLKQHEDYFGQCDFSDFKAFGTVQANLPSNIQLQLGNSTAVRYSQLFDMNTGIEVYCNRGTSGIDGSVSTAIGAAVISERQTVLITGDLSFLYDSNALWNMNIPSNFRIICFNNSGGGIFRILPGAKEQQRFEEFFETRHNLTAEYLCNMYNIEYRIASKMDELKEQLDSFFIASTGPIMLEIFTPPEINDRVLLDYFAYIK